MPDLTTTRLGAADKAYAWLQDQITTTPWDQELFFSENTIAEAAQVSRAPVREALLRLQAKELLRRVPHKGAYVPALTIRDLEDHLEVRKVVGDWATRKVTEHKLIDIDFLYDLVAQQAMHLDNDLKFIEVDRRFHSEIVKAARNQAFTSLYESQELIQRRLALYAISRDHGRLSAVVEEHREMVGAIASGDAEYASRINLAHLNETAKAMRSHLI